MKELASLASLILVLLELDCFAVQLNHMIRS